MEFAERGTLGNIIKKYEDKKISWEFIKFTIAEIILGLEYMHDMMICHRDLKPDNILYDQNYHVKIGDFGEAKKFKELQREEIKKDFIKYVKSRENQVD